MNIFSRYKILKSLLVLSVVLLATNSVGQDIIQTVTGEKIVCKVLKADSSKVFFRVRGNGSGEMILPRSEVKSIVYGKSAQPGSRKETDSSGTNNPGWNKKDPFRGKQLTSLTIIGGLNAPAGVYASTDLNNDASGYALPGFYFGTGITALTRSSVGLTFRLLSGKQEFDSKPLLSYALQQTGYIWKAERSYWKSLAFFGGFVVYDDIGRLRMQARLVAGYMSLSTPDVYIYIDPNNWVRQGSASAASLCYGAGASLVFKLTHDIAIGLDVDYYKSSFQYSGIVTYSSSGSSSLVVNMQQPFSSVCSGLCLSFGF